MPAVLDQQDPSAPCPAAGRPGRTTRAPRPRWWGCGPPRAPGRPRAAAASPAAAPRPAAQTLSRPGPGRWPGRHPGPRPCPLPWPPPASDLPPRTATPAPGDRCAVLPGRVPQDLQHLGGARHAGRHERGIRRVQPVPPDHLSLCHSLRVRRSPSLPVCRRSSTYRMSRSCPAVAPSCPVLAGTSRPRTCPAGYARDAARRSAAGQAHAIVTGLARRPPRSLAGLHADAFPGPGGGGIPIRAFCSAPSRLRPSQHRRVIIRTRPPATRTPAAARRETRGTMSVGTLVLARRRRRTVSALIPARSARCSPPCSVTTRSVPCSRRPGCRGRCRPAWSRC